MRITPIATRLVIRIIYFENFPTERYLNVVKRGYKDCDLDKKHLEKALVS